MGFPSFERKTGYDAGFVTDEYGCNLDKCECLHLDQAVIGESMSYLVGWFWLVGSGVVSAQICFCLFVVVVVSV